ncbi:hypothetical protein KAW18_10015 [candidate division WOR-3 bacterium]|nr:hypothetical protein [candidate division WOR-3 bacterium]
MNTKSKKGIIGITFVAIMIASIFAMVAPTAVAKGNKPVSEDYVPNSTINIYGALWKGPAVHYTDWQEPFDPTVIPKDSITFSPAIKEHCGAAGSNNTDLKNYLRIWYEPKHNFSQGKYPAIITENTYMIIHNKYKMPWDAPVSSTFPFPICEVVNQTGLGAFENTEGIPESPGGVGVVHLAGVGILPDNVFSGNKSLAGNITIEKGYTVSSGKEIQFIDHKVSVIAGNHQGTRVLVEVKYAGNADDDYPRRTTINKGEKVYFDRHNDINGCGAQWYVIFNDKWQDSSFSITVGYELHQCKTFYVNGVRYHVPAIEVLDLEAPWNEADHFKYITIRAFLPKCPAGGDPVRDDGDAVSSIWIDCIEKKEILPLLPPFNVEHSIVDDIDIPLWAPTKEEDKFHKWPMGDSNSAQDYFPHGEEYLTMQNNSDPRFQAWLAYFNAVRINTNVGDSDDQGWVAYDVKERIITNVNKTEVYYVDEDIEKRLSTNLLEKLNEVGVGSEEGIYENWTKFDIQTWPDRYTQFVLPEMPDITLTTYDSDSQEYFRQTLYGDYLITTSLVAPQATGDFPNQRVAFTYSLNRSGYKMEYTLGNGGTFNAGAELIIGGGIDLYVNEEILNKTTGTTTNKTVRVYGAEDWVAPEHWDHWEKPFNPTWIRKDSITFDAAMVGEGSAQSNDTNTKVYKRLWYEPKHHFEQEDLPAVILENTFMIVHDKYKLPWHGEANYTHFTFPIAPNWSSDQIGLELIENKNGEPYYRDVVRLVGVSNLSVGMHNKSSFGGITIEKKYQLQEGETVDFLIHGLTFIICTHPSNETKAHVKIRYNGNPGENSDSIFDQTHDLLIGKTYWFDRHNFKVPATDPKAKWYARFQEKWQDNSSSIAVGMVLNTSDYFYVDGVEYKVAAVEVLDLDGDGYTEKFKFITLRTNLPKGTDTLVDEGYEPYSSQDITMVPSCNTIPVLPPFNMVHAIIDDTDVPLWAPLKHYNKFPLGDRPNGMVGVSKFPLGERYLTMQCPPEAWQRYFRAVPIGAVGIPDDAQLWDGPYDPCHDGWSKEKMESWIANDARKRIVENVEPLDFCWWEESKEPRYSTNLLQVLNETFDVDGNLVEENWTKYDIQTIPDLYTAFRLPEMPDINYSFYIGGAPQYWHKYALPGSYLITTSFNATEAGGDLNDDQLWRKPDGDGVEPYNRFAFTYDVNDTTFMKRGIWINEDPVFEAVSEGEGCNQRFTNEDLLPGWNLISFKIEPEVGSRTPLEIFGQEIWKYDTLTQTWTSVQTDPVEPGVGYFIWSTSGVVWDVRINGTNTELTWDADILPNLHDGWTLVGPGCNEISVPGLYSMFWFDASSQTYKPVTEPNTMSPTKGYCILVGPPSPPKP